MSLLDDNSGIAYAMIHIMMVIIAVGVVWIFMGVVVDEYDAISYDLTTDHPDIWGASTTNAITDLSHAWSLILWVTVICSGVYGLVSSIRHERGGAINE